MIDIQEELKDIPSKIASSEVINIIGSNKITSKHLIKLKNVMDLTDEIISKFLNINVKTYRTYKSKTVKLNELTQEHILMLLSLAKHGIEVFGNKNDFSTWLQTNNFYYGKKPMELLNTINGIKFINDRLTGLEYGDNA